MCDQDQFEKDRLEYEARGVVTRRQFAVLLGAGVAMMLPKVANAVTVNEADVTVPTPDGLPTAISSTRRAAPRLVSWCGRTSSACGRRCGRWANGWPNRVMPCSW